MTASAGSASRPLPTRWLGWASAALLAIVFFLHLGFFFAWGSGIVWIYAIHFGWVALWLLAVTSFTRTVGLRMLTAFWFVGVYPATALVLLMGRPVAEVFGLSNAVVPGVLLPMGEELVKHLPVLLLFWFAARRNRWQLSATDGLVLGFMVGAGFAFHEELMFGRASGSGWDATPFSWLFPTIWSFRGEASAYQDVWVALVGLAIGAGFMLRTRMRRAWTLPVAAWLIVFIDHVTWNSLGGAHATGVGATVANVLRALMLDGALPIIALVVGIALAVFWELGIARSMGRRDSVFPAIPLHAFVEAAQAAPRGDWRHLQAMREYARRRRSAYYSLWIWEPVGADPAAINALRSELYALAQEAGVATGGDAPVTAPGA
ncbi:MAG TPA: PrsW family glutamic-type intramembrane protease [Methylomirabilota bacterium]|nr:PrsW family glutamic-type intramembrane protease [Methylomirabilota bacterium]